MQITGVQAVGARSLGSVTAAVAVSDPARVTTATADREYRPSAVRTFWAEAVVFPRDGKPLDRRPVQLRQQRANARYREDGRGRERGDSST